MATKMTHFVVASSAGAWGRGTTLKQATTNMQKQLGGGTATIRAQRRKMPSTAFASDQPINVQAGLSLRVQAQDEAILVEWEV